MLSLRWYDQCILWSVIVINPIGLVSPELYYLWCKYFEKCEVVLFGLFQAPTEVIDDVVFTTKLLTYFFVGIFLLLVNINSGKTSCKGFGCGLLL